MTQPAVKTDTAQATAQTLSTPPCPHLFTVQEYYQLGAAHIYPEDSRIELIEGALIDMAPIGSYHAGLVAQLTRLFVQKTRDDITVNVQNPIHLNDFSEPEPDLALLRPRVLPYVQAHPGPEDVLLLIEVADTSLDFDRNRKIPLYAQHAIPEVWLFDMQKITLTTFLHPADDHYQTIHQAGSNDPVSPHLLPQVIIDLGILFQDF